MPIKNPPKASVRRGLRAKSSGDSGTFRAVRAKERFLVYGAPAIGDAEIAEVVGSLKSGWLGTGPKVAQFEREFAAYRGAQHCVAVSSCTAALHLSMLAAGLEAG